MEAAGSRTSDVAAAEGGFDVPFERQPLRRVPGPA